jgi:hypothetical protein
MISRPLNSPLASERLYRIFAAHEAGHVVMYQRFGVDADVSFQFDDLGEMAGAMVTPHRPLDRLSDACVGWGGLMGEYLTGHVLLHVPGLPALTEKTVTAWAIGVWPSLNEYDKRMIVFSPDSEKARRLTFDVLSSPYGSSRLWDQAQRLVKIIRQEHAAALKSAGRSFLPAARQMARDIFSVCDEN